jgi:hypothetical protein
MLRKKIPITRIIIKNKQIRMTLKIFRQTSPRGKEYQARIHSNKLLLSKLQSQGFPLKFPPKINNPLPSNLLCLGLLLDSKAIVPHKMK